MDQYESNRGKDPDYAERNAARNWAARRAAAQRARKVVDKLPPPEPDPEGRQRDANLRKWFREMGLL